MAFLSSIGCLLNFHQPVRRNVMWNGKHYVGECRHCTAPIRRHGRRKWRRHGDTDTGRQGTSAS